MRVLDWNKLDAAGKDDALRRPEAQGAADKAEAVKAILADIRKRGDEALRGYALQFDGYAPEHMCVSRDAINNAQSQLDDNLKTAIAQAHANITAFHARQGYQAYEVETMPGITCRREVRGFDTVGIYIPGGSAPLFSTALMLAIPAKLAGSGRVILATPCGKNGRVHPAILYVAELCGVDTVLQLGGVQAIAALAYGTKETPPCGKIFGPGNIYVTLAKQQVASAANGPGIDIPAGPSEVMVVLDETCPPSFAAADLLAQAEHDPLSQVVLVAPKIDLITNVQIEMDLQLQDLPRADIARAAMANSTALVAADVDDQLQIVNLYAPEHLILACENADALLPHVWNAGSVFMGVYTPESLGDYASGTNHVLPTMGWARLTGGVSVETFQKTITVQRATVAGLQKLGPHVATMADAEGLDAHAAAVTIRLKASA